MRGCIGKGRLKLGITERGRRRRFLVISARVETEDDLLELETLRSSCMPNILWDGRPLIYMEESMGGPESSRNGG